MSCCLSVIHWKWKPYHKWAIFDSPYSLCKANGLHHSTQRSQNSIRKTIQIILSRRKDPRSLSTTICQVNTWLNWYKNHWDRDLLWSDLSFSTPTFLWNINKITNCVNTHQFGTIQLFKDIIDQFIFEFGNTKESLFVNISFKIFNLHRFIVADKTYGFAEERSL